MITNQIMINGMPIQQVRSAKVLGIYLEEHLTWSDHTDAVRWKIGKMCGILTKLKYCLPPIYPFKHL